MRLLQLCVTLGLIIPLTLVWGRSDGCNRNAPNGPDCSTAGEGQCQTLYHCNNGTDVLVSQLPFPAANIRTCYRTCFVDDECRTFPVHSAPQPLHVEANASGYTFQRVFSPRYGVGNYRKSTNCRYSVECGTEQTLAYSVITFNLEDKVNCSHGEECVDWVEVTFHHLGVKERFCGRGEFGETRVVGHNKISFEFASNRRIQDVGFLYFVRCVDDDSIALTQSCSKPFGSQPQIIQPSGLDYNPTNAPDRIVVDKRSVLVFKDNTITVHEGEQIIKSIKGIERLDVENSISKVTKIYYPSQESRLFYGYGVLAENKNRAYYFQTGADPILQPSRKEQAVILRIDTALNNFLDLDTFDVKDDLDTQELFQMSRSQMAWQRHYRYFSEEKHFKDNLRARKLAMWFRNACNPLLRASACDYLAVVEGRDCMTGMLLK